MRLTPSKIRGMTLPEAKPINKRGNTSLVYETDDPNILQIFTTERLKMEWWRYIDLIDYYIEDCATAVYQGFSGNNYTKAWTTIHLPVHACYVPRLDIPTARTNREIARVLAALRQMAFCDTIFKRWDRIAKISEEFPVLEKPVEFAREWGEDTMFPDFGTGDFAVWSNELIALDPVHERNSPVHKALCLTIR